jgi:hypothetical protein
LPYATDGKANIMDWPFSPDCQGANISVGDAVMYIDENDTYLAATVLVVHADDRFLIQLKQRVPHLDAGAPPVTVAAYGRAGLAVSDALAAAAEFVGEVDPQEPFVVRGDQLAVVLDDDRCDYVDDGGGAQD